MPADDELHAVPGKRGRVLLANESPPILLALCMPRLRLPKLYERRDMHEHHSEGGLLGRFTRQLLLEQPSSLRRMYLPCAHRVESNPTHAPNSERKIPPMLMSMRMSVMRCFD